MLPPSGVSDATLKGVVGAKPFEMRPSISVPGGEVLRAAPTKSFEIQPVLNLSRAPRASSQGCGCGGGCGPCGSKLELSVAEFTKSAFAQYQNTGTVQFNPPIREGGGRSVCETIQQEIEDLINRYNRARNRCETIAHEFIRCLRGTQFGCYSYQVQLQLIADQINELNLQRSPFNSDEENGRIDMAVSNLDMERAAILPIQRECDAAVNRDINLRRRECARQRRYAQGCIRSTHELGQYILRAFENYMSYAARLGCAVDPGLRLTMRDTQEWIRNQRGLQFPQSEFLSLENMREDYDTWGWLIYEVP